MLRFKAFDELVFYNVHNISFRITFNLFWWFGWFCISAGSFLPFHFLANMTCLSRHICQNIPNRLFHMLINSGLGEDWKYFLQFCYSIPSLLMQNTNLCRYLHRYLSMTFAVFVNYVYGQEYYYYAIVLLFYCPKDVKNESIINLEKSFNIFLYCK